MTHFYCKDKQVLVSTNLKVMYSSLTYFSKNICKSFIPLKNISSFFLKENNISFLEHYLLVRNPYKKIISFYKEKFLSLGNREVPSSYGHFFPYLGVDERIDSKTTIKEKVINTSFTHFISILSKIYSFDLHLVPQHWIMYPFKLKPITNIHNLNHLIIESHKENKKPAFEKVKIIKIDDITQIKEFASRIDFDLNIRECRTEGKIDDPELTSDTIKTINQIYQEDFEMFGYHSMLPRHVPAGKINEILV